jgi:hypothetical protein
MRVVDVLFSFLEAQQDVLGQGRIDALKRNIEASKQQLDAEKERQRAQRKTKIKVKPLAKIKPVARVSSRSSAH